jgi:prepilin-type N-terminal cleavage/methylation domain-containing protein
MRNSGRHSGFTLIELLIVVAVGLLVAGTAIPAVVEATRQASLNTSVQSVAAAIRGARYAAVAKNKTLRVRFNCPAANQFRVVEVTGNPAIDDAANRCSETAYPYPDPNPNVAPNIDGQMVRLGANSQFGAAQDIQIDTSGRVTKLTGCPTCVSSAAPATIALVNGYDTRTITVNASGQVQLP